MTGVLDRALEMLELIARDEATLDSLARATGVHKSTVLRTLQTMERRGFVRREGRHRYALGGAVLALAHASQESRDVLSVASAALRRLGAVTGQTVHLAAYDDGVVTYIDKVESRQPLRMYSRIGLRAALHATGVAKVLLGGLHEAELTRVLATMSFTPFTERTHRTSGALRADIVRSRLRGWAEDHEEHESFMNCVAAPVFAADGSIAAAISISAPNPLLTHAEVRALLPTLLETCRTVSRRLGCASDPTAILPPEPASPAPTTTPHPHHREDSP